MYKSICHTLIKLDNRIALVLDNIAQFDLQFNLVFILQK
jgi:hypothetical protein